jgi:predicted TIM-barrel fold metal-dependent hydrolase
MIGSNFPVERMAGSFGESYRTLFAGLDELSEDDRADVLAGTARRFYRLPAADRETSRAARRD